MTNDKFAKWNPLDNARKRENFLYCIADEQGHIKIGHSDNPWTRVSALQCGNAMELILVAWISFPNRAAAQHSERVMHKKYREFTMNGGSEWFDRSAPIKRDLWRLVRDYEFKFGGHWFDGITENELLALRSGAWEIPND